MQNCFALRVRFRQGGVLIVSQARGFSTLGLQNPPRPRLGTDVTNVENEHADAFIGKVLDANREGRMSDTATHATLMLGFLETQKLSPNFGAVLAEALRKGRETSPQLS
jgi:hypothetical protein